MKVKIFADGADLDSIRSLAKDSMIAGFTTNPTLMRQAGVDEVAIIDPGPDDPRHIDALFRDRRHFPLRERITGRSGRE